MHRYLPLILIVGLLVAFRILGGLLLPSDYLPNFQPLAALFFCGALLAPGWRGFAIPAAIWAVTYPFATGFEHNAFAFIATLTTTLLAFVAIFFMGKALSSRGFGVMLAGSLASAVVFHVVTNGAAWLGNPVYEKTLTGLWGSLWTGYPYPTPAWEFLRNFAIANVLFTAIFVGAQLRLPRLTVAASPRETALAK